MVRFEEALAMMSDKACFIGSEKVALRESVGRVLSEDIMSDVDMPPFNKSAVDGYACRQEDIGGVLRVVETIAAGQMPQFRSGPGMCSKIMTGAVMPEGADCVLMVEDTETNVYGEIVYRGVVGKRNFCGKAEDLKIADLVLLRGIKLEPKHVAMLAAVGKSEVMVARKPRIAVLSTGDELVEPSEKPVVAQIRNTNGWQLIAQIEKSACVANYYGIIKDTKIATYQALQAAMEENDVVLLTGGVSMGDFDFVPEIMVQLGVEIMFDRIAMQPGKPTTFGMCGKKAIIGLPGNPVSSFLQFELLVYPYLQKVMGMTEKEKICRLPIDDDYSRKNADRKSFVPVKIDENFHVSWLRYNGSAHIFALKEANAVASIEIGVKELKKGDIVDVRFIW